MGFAGLADGRLRWSQAQTSPALRSTGRHKATRRGRAAGRRTLAFGSRRGFDFMSVSAYILIQTEVGKAAAVAAQIQGLAGVASAEDVTGPYDVIVRAEAADVDELGKLVVANVQSVEGITRTLTCPVVHL